MQIKDISIIFLKYIFNDSPILCGDSLAPDGLCDVAHIDGGQVHGGIRSVDQLHGDLRVVHIVHVLHITKTDHHRLI